MLIWKVELNASEIKKKAKDILPDSAKKVAKNVSNNLTCYFSKFSKICNPEIKKFLICYTLLLTKQNTLFKLRHLLSFATYLKISRNLPQNNFQRIHGNFLRFEFDFKLRFRKPEIKFYLFTHQKLSLNHPEHAILFIDS